MVQFQPHGQVLHFTFKILSILGKRYTCFMLYFCHSALCSYILYIFVLYFMNHLQVFDLISIVFFKSNTAWNWIRRQVMKWLYHQVLGTQRKEALPCFSFFSLDLLTEVSGGHKQSCPLYSFGFFEKAQYSEERNPKTFLREEALWLCYSRLSSLGQ